jgi:hypothetical protein
MTDGDKLVLQIFQDNIEDLQEQLACDPNSVEARELLEEFQRMQANLLRAVAPDPWNDIKVPPRSAMH